MVKLAIGCDGSACSADAIDDLRRAGLPQDNVDATVIAVADVWPNPPGAEYAKVYPDVAERMWAKVEEALAEARTFADSGRAQVARLFPAWRVRSEVIGDSPYWGLIKQAAQVQADLLVVGSHGRSLAGRLAFGSVSQNAVLYADCSVRIGRCPADTANSADASGGAAGAVGGGRGGGSSGEQAARIMLGWDDSPDAELAFRAVAARRFAPGSAARIVTALDANLVSRLPDGIVHLVQRARELADELRATGLAVEEAVLRNGHAKRVLLDEIDAWRADCIFVGAKGLSRIARVLVGSVSSAVAARARCSVEVVRSRQQN